MRLLSPSLPSSYSEGILQSFQQGKNPEHMHERGIPLPYIPCRWSVSGRLIAWLVLPGLCCHGHRCGLLTVLQRWEISFPHITLPLGGGFGSSLSIAAAREEADSIEYHRCRSPTVPDTDETEQQAQVQATICNSSGKVQAGIVTGQQGWLCVCFRGSEHCSAKTVQIG